MLVSITEKSSKQIDTFLLTERLGGDIDQKYKCGDPILRSQIEKAYHAVAAHSLCEDEHAKYTVYHYKSKSSGC